MWILSNQRLVPGFPSLPNSAHVARHVGPHAVKRKIG